MNNLTCIYCFGDRGPVVEGTCWDDATCAACREDGGPSAGQDYFDRPTASEHPEYWQE